MMNSCRCSLHRRSSPGAARSVFSSIIALTLTLAALSSVVRAELPSVRFDRIQPLGGGAGTTVDVQILGADIEGVKSLLFDHAGLKAEPVEGKERTFRIAIGADVPSGTYDVRLVGRFGVSNPRLFAVTRGLADVTEVEPNNSVDKAQTVPLNSAVHGSSDQNDQDVFRFSAKKGQRVTIECQAGRLDSALDPTLVLTTLDGAPLAANGDYHGRDPFIDFVAPADGDYLATVGDLSYRGGHPYQLAIGALPQLENAFPRVVAAGKTTELQLFGRNLGGGATVSPLKIADLPLEELKVAVTPPADILQLGAFRFIEHPTDHSTLPTAATCTLTGFQALTGLPNERGPAVPLMVTDYPISIEREPNDAREQAQALPLPGVVSGRFDGPRDADWYEIDVATAGNYAIDVYCERIAGRADPYVAVFDEQGNRVTELDDFGHRVNAFDGHLRDPSGNVNLAAKKKYKLLVQDRYRRGGPRYQYVLSVRPPRGDFYISAIHSQNPGPGGTTVRQGGATYLDVVIHHTEGFSGPVTITATDLPPGVKVAPTTIHGTSGVVVVTAAPDAQEWNGFVRLTATGKRDDMTEIAREVRSTTRVWTDTNMPGSRPTRQLALAVRDSAPYAIRFEPESTTIVAGQKVDVKLKLERRWEKFNASVNVLPLSLPGGFKYSNQEIPAGAMEVTIPLEVNPGTRPGVYTLSLLGQAQVPFNKDPAAADKPNTLVSLPTSAIQVTVVAK